MCKNLIEGNNFYEPPVPHTTPQHTNTSINTINESSLLTDQDTTQI